MMKILVTPTSLQPGKNDAALAPLKEFADELVFNQTGKPLSEEDLIPLLSGCDGYLAGLDFVTEKVLKACPDLTALERELLATGARVITLEQAVRFLTDYLENNVYFKTDYPEHNLVRARNQFRILQEMLDWEKEHR